jgi:hypothetical protein
MNMISVVIPTLWKYLPFCDFLIQVCENHHVQDVIIVDNDRTNRPVHDVLLHNKITMLDFGQNMYVNPSWNLGVYHATASIICLQNDDIEFDCGVYDKVDASMQPHMGLISLSCQPPQSDQIEIRLWQGESQFGCGQLMFINRNNFCHIDPELKVYCGDAWLFDHMWHITQQNYMIHNLNYYTPYAQTSKNFRHMWESELAHYCAMCQQLQIAALHVK